MNIRPEVQEELRSLFARGATPSRLIQHIAASHRGEQLHGLIQEYFRETFGVPIVRGLNPLEDYSSVGLTYAYLNRDVLHEMIQTRSAWDRDVENSWLGTLEATNIDDRLRDVAQQPYWELARVWDNLDSREQFAIQRVIAGFNGYFEQVKILCQLAERLQQRINELEGESDASPAGDELVRNERK